MPTVFTKGDLFATAGIDAYAIGVSAAGTMDAGTAVAFRKKWPAFFDGYKAACAGGLHAGDVFEWRGGDALVYALVLSPNEATSPKLPAFMSALGRMLSLAAESQVTKLAMPRVGTKTARTQVGQGLDWTRVKKVLSEIGDTTPVTMVVVEQFIRGKDALEGVTIPEPTAIDEAGADEDELSDATGEALEAIPDNAGEATTPKRRATPKKKKAASKKTTGKPKKAAASKKPAAKKSAPKKTSTATKTSAKKKTASSPKKKTARG